jgi:hypothetical protein
MPDINMHFGLELARGLSASSIDLPVPLVDAKRRAEFVHAIDRPLLIDDAGHLQPAALGAHLHVIATTSVELMPEVADPLDRIAIALRLWAGCLMAGKSIAMETRDGANSVDSRRGAFQEIDAVAATDPIFCAGVEAAPDFKRLRGDEVSLDGVPLESPVWRFV